jgi:hypothetical protein
VRLYARDARVSEAAEERMVRETEDVGGAFIKELVRRAVLFHLERVDENAIDEIDVQAAVDELLHREGDINVRRLGAPSGFSARTRPVDELATDGRSSRPR